MSGYNRNHRSRGNTKPVSFQSPPKPPRPEPKLLHNPEPLSSTANTDAPVTQKILQGAPSTVPSDVVFMTSKYIDISQGVLDISKYISLFYEASFSILNDDPFQSAEIATKCKFLYVKPSDHSNNSACSYLQHIIVHDLESLNLNSPYVVDGRLFQKHPTLLQRIYPSIIHIDEKHFAELTSSESFVLRHDFEMTKANYSSFVTANNVAAVNGSKMPNLSAVQSAIREKMNAAQPPQELTPVYDPLNIAYCASDVELKLDDHVIAIVAHDEDLTILKTVYPDFHDYISVMQKAAKKYFNQTIKDVPQELELRIDAGFLPFYVKRSINKPITYNYNVSMKIEGLNTLVLFINPTNFFKNLQRPGFAAQILYNSMIIRLNNPVLHYLSSAFNTKRDVMLVMSALMSKYAMMVHPLVSVDPEQTRTETELCLEDMKDNANVEDTIAKENQSPSLPPTLAQFTNEASQVDNSPDCIQMKKESNPPIPPPSSLNVPKESLMDASIPEISSSRTSSQTPAETSTIPITNTSIPFSVAMVNEDPSRLDDEEASLCEESDSEPLEITIDEEAKARIAVLNKAFLQYPDKPVPSTPTPSGCVPPTSSPDFPSCVPQTIPSNQPTLDCSLSSNPFVTQIQHEPEDVPCSVNEPADSGCPREEGSTLSEQNVQSIQPSNNEQCELLAFKERWNFLEQLNVNASGLQTFIEMVHEFSATSSKYMPMFLNDGEEFNTHSLSFLTSSMSGALWMELFKVLHRPTYHNTVCPPPLNEC